MNTKQSLTLTLLTNRKNLEKMLYRISNATEGMSTYNHKVLDEVYEHVEDALLSIENAQQLIDNLD